MKPMNALERAIQNRSNQSLEQIALQFEPLAQAMAALTDETRETLESIQTSAREQADEMALLGQKGRGSGKRLARPSRRPLRAF